MGLKAPPFGIMASLETRTWYRTGEHPTVRAPWEKSTDTGPMASVARGTRAFFCGVR